MNPSPFKGLRKDCMAIAYWYDREARARLDILGLDKPDEYLLVEGAGKIVYQRLKRYGKEKLVEMLKEYLVSEKFEEHPMLRVALDAHTLVSLQTNKLK